MFKTTTAVAVALGAIAALALPAAAPADWRHKATPVESNVQIGLTGQVRVEGGLGGVECQVTAKATFQPGQTGLVETFAAHPTNETTNCKGLGGLAFCQAHDLTALELSWTLHEGETAIKLTSGPITGQATGGFCPVKHINLAAGTITITPNQYVEISSGQLSGQLTAQLETNAGTKDSESVTVSGTLNVESPNAGTYSLGGPFYYIDGEEGPIGEEAEAVELDEQNAAAKGWLLTLDNGVELGPCEFKNQVKAWTDNNGVGRVEINGMQFKTPCPTSLDAKECQVTTAAAENQPWLGTLFYDPNNEFIPTERIGTVKPIKFSYTVTGEKCGGLKNVKVTATAKGLVMSTHVGTGCYKFAKAGDFTTTIGGVSGTLDAEYCRRDPKSVPVPAK